MFMIHATSLIHLCENILLPIRTSICSTVFNCSSVRLFVFGLVGLLVCRPRGLLGAVVRQSICSCQTINLQAIQGTLNKEA